MTEPDVSDQLDRVVGVAHDVLGSDLLGMYLFGSAVLGGLRPRSDLDVLAVAGRRTTQPEWRRLADGVMAFSHPAAAHGPGRRVELTIVVQSEVRPFRLPGRIDFQYGEWLRAEFAAGNPQPWEEVSRDVAVLITMVLQADRPLYGPPPSVVLDVVPRRTLQAAMTDDLARLLAALGTDTRNVLLTLARIWSTVETGEIRSKDAAASWALARLPPEHRPVLARARAIYLGDEREAWDDLTARVGPHADHVVIAIREAAAAARR